MVGITILAIVLGIGIPSFTDIIRSNRLASEVNGLVTALNYARSEAYKQGIRVSVCAANTSGTCSTTATWNQGWICLYRQPEPSRIDKCRHTFRHDSPNLASKHGRLHVLRPTPTTLSFVSFLPLGSPQQGQWQILQ
jgi:type IV fimbrial biogenesis protein FimT